MEASVLGSVPQSASAKTATYEEVAAAIRQAKTVFITAHVGPDGDTLGSMLALKWALTQGQAGPERIDCVISGKMPDVYRCMPGIETVLDMESSPDLCERYDLGISVDCGTLGRLGPAAKPFEEARLSINIDHHISNQYFGQLNLVVPDAGASGEVIAYLLDHMGVAISLETAICLYITLLTDTGGFRFASTKPPLLRLAARLVEIGADPEALFKAIYESFPMPQAKLHSLAVWRNEQDCSGRLIWTQVSQADLVEHDALEEHIEGMIDRIREIEGVWIAALFKESKEGKTKVSLRSNKHSINVAAVLEPLGGGGHVMAAGCNLDLPLQEGKELVLSKLRELL
jgi:bifunctional oligoribonuclease and PAP phosphatase NrnA